MLTEEIDYFREVKERVDVRAVLEHVLGPPERNGKWLCVFHPEKSASLSEKGGGIVCFGCGWRGDIFRFLQEHIGMGALEALSYVGEFAGLSVPQLDGGEPRHRGLSAWGSIFRRESERLAADIERTGRKVAAEAWRAAFREVQAGNIESAWELAASAAAIDRALA